MTWPRAVVSVIAEPVSSATIAVISRATIMSEWSAVWTAAVVPAELGSWRAPVSSTNTYARPTPTAMLRTPSMARRSWVRPGSAPAIWSAP